MPQVSKGATDRIEAATAEARSAALRLEVSEGEGRRAREALGRAERELAEADGRQRGLEDKVRAPFFEF